MSFYCPVLKVVEPNEDVPDMIFAVVIQIQTSSNYKAIPGTLDELLTIEPNFIILNNNVKMSNMS
jgi:hypothetical protein